MFKLLNLIILSVVTLLSTSHAFGFSVSPMFLDMKPNGTDARSVITVVNSSPRPIPVSASISELIIDPNGNVKTIPKDEDFLIFPPRAVIKPHSKQSFRVQWRSQPNLSIARTYEITISQILAKDERTKEQNEKVSINVQLGLAFSSVINMQAAQGAPKPTVKSSRLSRNKQGKSVLEVIISNGGNQNFLLVQADSSVIVYGASNRELWRHTYTADNMVRNFGLGIVQPNKSRRMKIPLPNLPDHIARAAKSVKLEIRPSAK